VRVCEVAPDIDLLALAAARPDAFPVLLESVTGPDNQRFDLLLGEPGESLALEPTGERVDFVHARAFWDALDQWIRPDAAAHALPFCGGWFVYLGYEAAAGIEAKLALPSPPEALPIAFAQRMRAALIRDRATQRCYWLSESGAEPPLNPPRFDPQPIAPAAPTEDPPERFLADVETIRAHIAAGDVFQVNLSRAQSTRAPDAAAAALYFALKRSNPAPFAGLFQHPHGAVISSSPERLIQVQGRRISTRPIAGTRPRTPGLDLEQSAELLAHPKERAEHIMLIDLERNDLGRVCEPGSVVVDELMAIERYAHVLHIVSNVSGQLRPDITPTQVLRAVFPGGTITGCPKLRCMQIISALEGIGRGPYTGSMGYVSRDGQMDFNILIRTMSLSEGTLRWRTGAGIVTDSIAAAELDETRAKARGLLRALGF
jgi:anthranilate synthase component I